MGGIGSYISDWRVIPINIRTWTGYEPLTGVKKVKVSNKVTDNIPKIQSGSMVVDLPANGKFENGWYRIQVAKHDSSGHSVFEDVATLLFELSSGEYEMDFDTVTVKGQSVLKPVEDRHMGCGTFIMKGEKGGEWCRKTLSSCTPAPVVVDESEDFTIDRYFVFDGGMSCLKAVWKVLDSASWIMRIHGDGSIHLMRKPTTVKAEFDAYHSAYIQPGIAYDEDASDVPNVYYARLNGLSAEARNEDPDSIASIQNKTYIKDVSEIDPMPVNGETLEHYVNRMLEESSVITKKYSYSRFNNLDVDVFDNVYWNIPGFHTGVTRILEQTMSSDKGYVIDEVCGEEIKLWTMKR